MRQVAAHLAQGIYPTTMQNTNLTLAQVATFVAGTAFADQPTAPELAVVQACILALPAGQYNVYDPDQCAVPAQLHWLAPQMVARWSGQQAGSMGYGDVTLYPSAAGTVLAFSMAGSTGSSAITVWVVPTDLLA